MAGYFEADAALPFKPTEILTGCIEYGAGSVLLDEDSLTADFFNLSTGLAGELLHKLGNYRIRLAGVVPDPSVHSNRFQEFLRETNDGEQFRFFATRSEAIRWLESG